MALQQTCRLRPISATESPRTGRVPGGGKKEKEFKIYDGGKSTKYHESTILTRAACLPPIASVCSAVVNRYDPYAECRKVAATIAEQLLVPTCRPTLRSRPTALAWRVDTALISPCLIACPIIFPRCLQDTPRCKGRNQIRFLIRSGWKPPSSVGRGASRMRLKIYQLRHGCCRQSREQRQMPCWSVKCYCVIRV